MKKRDMVRGILEAGVWYVFIYYFLYVLKNPVELWLAALVLLVLAYVGVWVCSWVRYMDSWRMLAEHRELHGLWNILTKHKGRGGYSRHPETLRWVNKRSALFQRHKQLAQEFSRRGYSHYSEINKKLATGLDRQSVFINTVREQKEILKNKPCQCYE